MSVTSESAENNVQKIASGAIGFFIFISLYVNEFSWYANTFNRNKLIAIGVFIGLLGGLAIGYKLQHKSQEIIGKFQICLAMMILGAILMPLIFSISNRILSFGSPQEELVEFVKNEGFNESRFGRVSYQ